MKIVKLNIENFRSFKGEGHTIEFSTSDEHPITIVFARNGVGKTNLMQAILWCLYGSVSNEINNANRIMNHDEGQYNESEHKYEKDIRCLVEMTILVENEKFKIQRFTHSKNYPETTVKVYRTKEKQTMPISGDSDIQQQFINQIIPETMANFFFFDGETSTKLVDEKNKEEMKSATRTILGCDYVDTSIDQLNGIMNASINQSKKLVKPRKNDSTNVGNLKTLQKDLKDHADLKAAVEQEIEDFVSDMEKRQKEINKKSNNASNADQTNKLLEEITEESGRLADLKSDRNDIETDVRKWLSTDEALDILMTGVGQEVLDSLGPSKSDIKFPTPYFEGFIEDLLESYECICGREFEKDDECYKTLSKKIALATRLQTVEQYNTTRSKARDFKKRSEKLKSQPKELISLRKLHDKCDRKVRQSQKKFDSIKGQGKDKDKSANNKILSDFAQLIEDQTIDNTRKEAKEKYLKNEWLLENNRLTKAINDISKASQKSDLIDKKIKKYEEIRDHIKEIVNDYEITSRYTIKDGIVRDLEKYWDEEVKVEFTKDYVLKLLPYDKKTKKVKKFSDTFSSGQSSLLSQIYTSNLIKYCKSSYKSDLNDKDLIVEAETLPFVLDSPFGHLDTKNQLSAAKCVRDASYQTIYCVSERQAGASIKKLLEPKVGRVYAIQGYRTKTKKEEDKEYLKELTPEERKETKEIFKAESGLFEWGKKKVEAMKYNADYKESKFLEMF